MKRVLVIEDGDEYATFARALLADAVELDVAHSGEEALAKAGAAERFLVDLRFDRLDAARLVGDLEAVGHELFGGDRARSLRHVQDQQGLYILRELRAAGHPQRAVFVHDFPVRRLRNVRGLYGDVAAVPAFDADALRTLLGGP